ncbi:hypothetical protein SG34_007425 [Thalassomonas viridans]|uniref:Uncharacterized protein n=1 Tax=Thalassomonas viridans TaxID=137584 RepID=A0AAE9Z643_9GAMM|nr:hypothetical protein [Thalassomonas viridans]WDE06725.1 hypothetical protein SG34_007425 [Thalassomonas viridans]
MKLQLNKKKLKNLSKDAQTLPSDMTPNIAGGFSDDCTPITDAKNCLGHTKSYYETGCGCGFE